MYWVTVNQQSKGNEVPEVFFLFPYFSRAVRFRLTVCDLVNEEEWFSVVFRQLQQEINRANHNERHLKAADAKRGKTQPGLSFTSYWFRMAQNL